MFRGLDVENLVDLNINERLNIFSLFKLRFSLYPNRKEVINNQRVRDRIIKLAPQSSKQRLI